MFIDLPKETLSILHCHLHPINDELAIEYFNLIDAMNKQVLSDAEIPRSYLPVRVQMVLRPCLKPLGYRFGFCSKGDEKLWGFKRNYA
ncbi:hypothetical protein L8R84_11980 [Vibrio splendidus]|uniref:hypothetical protein n=1 Tax=Vibrio splendidus TaxID=29497 RepID=UPI002469C464|nr:hypothetical protein [Vibrio splendidus]MDH5936858.1 hypothetical protein [Vibrio splendidus]